MYSPKHARRSTSRLAPTAVAGSVLAGLGIALSPSSASASTGTVWDRVAACESGGNWSINTG
ncbi:MAG: transglycosylase-like protein, partial [Micrococcales bacterium]